MRDLLPRLEKAPRQYVRWPSKLALGKLEFHGEMAQQLALNNLLPLAVTVPHALDAGALPAHHSDPFDRMLVAQARIESLTLMTHNARLREYSVPVLAV